MLRSVLKEGNIFYITCIDSEEKLNHMFQMADESYAVENAHEELKKYATEVIGSNDEDGVAKWLEKHFEK